MEKNIQESVTKDGDGPLTDPSEERYWAALLYRETLRLQRECTVLRARLDLAEDGIRDLVDHRDDFVADLWQIRISIAELGKRIPDESPGQ